MTFSLTFTADAGTDEITTSAPHGLVTGDGPVTPRNVGGALPTAAPALTALTDYWVIVTGASTMKLATSSANALANTAIDITSAGTGTHYLEYGIPYRRPRTYAVGSQLKSADLNSNFDAWKALHALLTGQTQSLWDGITLAEELQAAAVTLTGPISQTGIISPTALPSGNTDDWAPTDLATANLVRVTTNALHSTLRGLTGGAAGRRVTLVNLGLSNGNLVLAHNDVGSLAANRFFLPGSSSLTIRPFGSAEIWYDGDLPGWRVLSAVL